MQLEAGLCINVAPPACWVGESPDQGGGSTRLLQDQMIPTPSASSAGHRGTWGQGRDLQGVAVAPAVTVFWSHLSTDLGAGRADRLARSSGPAGTLELFHQRGLGHPGLGAALGALTGLDCPSVEASRLGPAGGLIPQVVLWGCP